MFVIDLDITIDDDDPSSYMQQIATKKIYLICLISLFSQVQLLGRCREPIRSGRYDVRGRCRGQIAQQNRFSDFQKTL